MTSINGYVDNYTANKPARYNGYPTLSGIVYTFDLRYTLNIITPLTEYTIT